MYVCLLLLAAKELPGWSINQGMIDFSNTVHKADIERLAELDDHEVVREVQVGVKVKDQGPQLMNRG